MYFGSEQLHSQITFIAVFQLNALSPCAQHSAFCLKTVSQSLLHMYRKKLLQTLHTSG